MISAAFHVEPASWSADQAELHGIRTQVFVDEQGVPAEAEVDEFDPRAWHVLARDPEGRAIGTGRLIAAQPQRLAESGATLTASAASIGRMAVLAEWRGKGVGSAILRVLLEHARARGERLVELHAQIHAIPFYARHGFVAQGEEFDECGIAHRLMRLELEASAPRGAQALPPRPEPAGLWARDAGQAREAILTLLRAARHEATFYTHDLDPELLDVTEVIDEVRRLALSGRRARIRIIVHDVRAPTTRDHRLVALAQRLSSAFEIRVPAEEVDQQYPSAFVLNDAGGYFFRPLAGRSDGHGSTYAGGRHRQLLSLFNEVWERSQPSEELRLLGL